MPPSTVKQSLGVGLDFIEFLGETNRKSTSDKIQLRDIYNSEFRNRDGGKDPNFSRVIYALRKYHKASVRPGKVRFNQKVREVYQDQWRTPGRQWQPPSVQPGVGGVSPSPPAGAAATSPSDSETRVQARRRLVNHALKSLKGNRSIHIADKNGITITSDLDTPETRSEGKIRYDVEHSKEVRLFTISIQNTGTKSVYFCHYTALHWLRVFALFDEKRVKQASPLLLHPGSSYDVQVQFRSQEMGFFVATLAFEFKLELSGSKPFHIVRFVEAMCSTKLALELAPVAPYRRSPVIKQMVTTYEVDEGELPQSDVVQRLKRVLPLGEYNYPHYLKELPRFLQGQGHPHGKTEDLQSAADLLKSPLSFQNYTKRFQLLLQLEEIQMAVDIRKYDMKDVVMVKDTTNKKLLVLEVPGVAENRPSVLKGDHILVYNVGDLEPITKHKGYVHGVELESVKLSFSKKLMDNFINKMRFNVEFTINRFPLKLQHRAVALAVQNQLEEVLFPKGSSARTEPLPSLRLFDSKLEQNPEQYNAVQCIVGGVSKPAPYLVFGPPGTGKTVTIVEAIKQVHKARPSTHILACAPSNSATDLLCERTLQHGMDSHNVYRLYASSRDVRFVPPGLLGCCNWDSSQKAFVFPSKDDLMKYKVLFTTVVTAGRLVSGGLPRDHFSHIFVDEAGHAVEPECIIGLSVRTCLKRVDTLEQASSTPVLEGRRAWPVFVFHLKIIVQFRPNKPGLLCGQTGQLVLAGDPRQLGPILRSPIAINHGLGLSLLERLMTQNSLYTKDEETGQFDGRFVTKLLRNYRNHPDILKIPNELFYEGELQAHADVILRNSYCSWEHLPKKGFPIIFHGVAGKDEREENSPSFFNRNEIVILVDYLKKLLQTQGKKGLSKLSPRDIGIIAPYRKQVQKIQKAIKSLDKELSVLNGINELKVGSVEEFQGQERKVILVSAVRSNSTFVKADHEFSIGFLKNEKRFNVAVTRAKALLIVVGNPLILNEDPTWGKFISYCTEKEGYTGFDYASEEANEEVLEDLAMLSLNEKEVDTEESVVQQQTDPEWKSEQ